MAFRFSMDGSDRGVFEKKAGIWKERCFLIEEN
jgi:hypothetical protein